VRAGTRLAALLLVVLPGQALAAPPPVCRLIPDVAGDAGWHPLGALSSTPAVPGTADDDLLSADLASDGRHLTVVWRLRRIAVPDPRAPMGRDYNVHFSVRGKGVWFVAARTYPTGTQFLYGDVANELGVHDYLRVLGQARGRIDPARGLVVVDVPASAVAGGLRRGTTLRAPAAAVSRWVGQGNVPSRQVAGLEVPLAGTAVSFDDASGRSYVVGTRSCVHPGL
jgi:hypothetical protein